MSQHRNYGVETHLARTFGHQHVRPEIAKSTVPLYFLEANVATRPGTGKSPTLAEEIPGLRQFGHAEKH